MGVDQRSGDAEDQLCYVLGRQERVREAKAERRRLAEAVELRLAELVLEASGVVPNLRELAPEVPEELEDVVMRCLARIPEYRPSSAGALAADLTATSGELPTVALGPDDAEAEAPTRVAATGTTRVAPAPEDSRARDRGPVGRAPTALVIGALVVALAVGAWVVFEWRLRSRFRLAGAGGRGRQFTRRAGARLLGVAARELGAVERFSRRR